MESMQWARQWFDGRCVDRAFWAILPHCRHA
jgi:hypothetical protein